MRSDQSGKSLGAVAVVLSLLYLAAQVRHGTKTTEDSATRDIFVAVTEQLALIGSQENREVLLRGLLSFKELDSRDKVTFDGLMGGLLTLCESIFMSTNARIVGDETMENIAFYLRTRLLVYPGMLEWWAQSKGSFVLESQRWIDLQIENADVDSDFWKIK